MIVERTAEQRERERDVRLAWIIIGICTYITATLLVLVAPLGGGTPNDGCESMLPSPRTDFPAGDVLARVPDGPQAQPLNTSASWVGPGDYPAGALRSGAGGAVRVTLAVGAGGFATGCQVAESSGFGSLDVGACNLLMRNVRFAPDPAGGRGVRRWTSPHPPAIPRD